MTDTTIKPQPNPTSIRIPEELQAKMEKLKKVDPLLAHLKNSGIILAALDWFLDQKILEYQGKCEGFAGNFEEGNRV